MTSRLAFLACFLVALFFARTAHAQGTDLERAKDLFRQGNELRKAGDCSRALAFYLESRGLVPSVANTTNAAVCMAELGKDDEALEMYEELLVKFRAELTDEESRTLAGAMAGLRRKLGRVDVASNVEGLIVIDGRTRGHLPLLAPIPVTRGAHVIRVIKEGYETFEQKVTVEIGATVTIDAKLAALAHAGRLRVEVASGEEGADVVVDGAIIGRAPWEGTLTPGPHLLVVRNANRGTAPLRAMVVESQTVTTRTTLAELGPELRVVPDPPSARIAIDGVIVAAGEWRGALPLGQHLIEAHEEAYLPAQITLDVTSSPHEPVVLRLPIDPAHPRWAVRRVGRIWAEAWGAVGIGSGLGSGAEVSCDRVACSDTKAALGGMFGIRAGYELPFGLSLQIGGGYLALRTTLARKLESSFTQIPVTYDLKDTIDFSGPFASTGLGVALPLGEVFEVGARTEIGVVLAAASDAVTGTISGGGRTLDLSIQRSGSKSHGAAPFVLPEVNGRVRFGRYYAGVGAAVAIFFVSGPSLETGDAAPKGFDCGAHPGAADCAPASSLLRGERAFGPAIIWLPSVELGARF